MLGYKFVLWWGPGPSVDHDLLNHSASLRLKDVTIKNYVIECLLPLLYYIVYTYFLPTLYLHLFT